MLFLNYFKSDRNSKSLVFQSIDLLKWNFIEVFQSLCPLVNMSSDNTLNIEIVKLKDSESIHQQNPNLLESLYNSEFVVNSVRNFRWKKRSLKSDNGSYPVSKRSKLDTNTKSNNNPTVSQELCDQDDNSKENNIAIVDTIEDSQDKTAVIDSVVNHP